MFVTRTVAGACVVGGEVLCPWSFSGDECGHLRVGVKITLDQLPPNVVSAWSPTTMLLLYPVVSTLPSPLDPPLDPQRPPFLFGLSPIAYQQGPSVDGVNAKVPNVPEGIYFPFVSSRLHMLRC